MYAGKILYIVHVWDTFSLQLYRWEQQSVKLMFFYMLVEFHQLKVLTVFECSLELIQDIHKH